MIPHCSVGAIALAASLQFCFATENAIMQEQGLDAYGESATTYAGSTAAFKVEDGVMTRSRAPGLGIEIDEAVVEDLHHDPGSQQAREIYTRPARWSHPDGAFAEW